MISIESYPGGRKHKQPPDMFAKLRSHRIHRVITNYGEYLRLAKDAIEKLGGEFVIDMRYLLCLMDDAFSVADEILQDTNVLLGFRFNRLFLESQRLRTELRYVLAGQPLVKTENLVIPFCEIDELEHYHEIGGELAKLAEVRRQLKLPVPDGFVISASAFGLFAEYNGLEWLLNPNAMRAAALSPAQIQERICSASLPPDLADRVKEAVVQVCETHGRRVEFILTGELLSGDCEKLHSRYFKTAVNVTPEKVLLQYRSILSSLFSTAVPSSGLEAITASGTAAAVVVTRKLDSQFYGRIRTVSPDDPNGNHILVETEDGGRVQCCRVSRRPPYKAVSSSAGIGKWPLSDDDVADLAEKALRVERYLRKPQEIAWAKEDDDIYFTETKPLAIEGAHDLTLRALSEAVAQHEVLYDDEGKVASPGIASGAVHILSESEIPEEFPDHAVIVVRDFEPSAFLIRHLPMAAAVLADRGELVGHAAALAREFRVPAIVGLGDATERLRGGEFVTVDADDNAIYNGRVEELIDYQLLWGDSMENEREYKLLRFILHRLTSRGVAGSCRPGTRAGKRGDLESIVRSGAETACRELSSTVVSLMPRLKAAGAQLENGFGLKLTLVDLGRGIDREAGASSPVSGGLVKSAPLAAFRNGLVDSLRNDNQGIQGLGLAAISDVRMHVIMKTNSRTFALHAFCGEAADNNYIFGCFAGDDLNETRNRRPMLWVEGVLQRCGFEIGHTDNCITFWEYARTACETEDGLTMLGGMIVRMEHGAPADQTGTPLETGINAFVEHYTHSDTHTGRC